MVLFDYLYHQAKESLSNVTDEIQDLKKKMDDEAKNQSGLQKIIEKISQIRQRSQNKKTEIDKEQVRVETIKGTLLENLTNQSIVTLENRLQGFEGLLATDEKELKEAERSIKDIKTEIATSQQKQFDLTQRKGVLLAEKANYEKDLKRRIEIMVDIHNTYDLKYDQSQGSYKDGNIQEFGTQATSFGRSILSQGSVTTLGRPLTMLSQESITIVPEEDLLAFQSAIKDKLEELGAELLKVKRQHQKVDDEIQGNIGECSSKIHGLEAGKRFFYSGCHKIPTEAFSYKRALHKFIQWKSCNDTHPIVKKHPRKCSIYLAVPSQQPVSGSLILMTLVKLQRRVP